MTYQPGNRVFQHIRRCSLQYVFIKPTLSAVAILLHILGVYRPGSLNIESGYLWINIILNVSATLALFFIFLFYDLIKRRITPYRPLYKLLSIKILVFFIFWQTMLVSILYHFNVLPHFFGWTIERSSETVQNILICIEMAILAIFNLYAFPYEQYRTQPGNNTLNVALDNISFIVDHADLINHTKDAFNPIRVKHAIDKHSDWERERERERLL